jgi:hypothetical protein
MVRELLRCRSIGQAPGSVEEDVLLDRMDEVWREMSDDQRGLARRLAACGIEGVMGTGYSPACLVDEDAIENRGAVLRLLKEVA